MRELHEKHNVVPYFVNLYLESDYKTLVKTVSDLLRFEVILTAVAFYSRNSLVLGINVNLVQTARMLVFIIIKVCRPSYSHS